MTAPRYPRKGERVAARCRVCNDWLIVYLGGPLTQLVHPECRDVEVDPEEQEKDLSERQRYHEGVFEP